ncbi:MAG: DUF2188 domain-containing protein [Candidatus Binatia bacterium]
MSKKDAHVVRSSKGSWVVRKSGSSRAAKVFDSHEAAVTYGRTLAKNEGSDLYVHHPDGTIRNKNSYGKDPFPPREKTRRESEKRKNK